MKTALKVLSFACALLIAVFIGFSIGKNGAHLLENLNASEDKLEKSSEYRVVRCEPSDEYVKALGRTVYDGGERWFSMSGSGISFVCSAKYADITLLCENASSLTVSHRPRVAVYAGGELLFDMCLSENETAVHLDLSAFTEEVQIDIIKLSESMHSACGVGEISAFANSKIVPAKEKSLKIEFIGDSITTGYGTDAGSTSTVFSTATQDFTKSYAYLAAKALDADYSAVAFSGYGVLSGYSSGYGKNSEHVISNVYGKAITNKSFPLSPYPLSSWDFSQFQADITVINLGVNDASYCSTTERRQAFIEEYKKLIGLVRWNNKNTFILCILGDANDSLYPFIETAVAEYTAQTGDSAVSCKQIHYNMGTNGSVLSGHPTAQSHIEAGRELSDILSEIVAKKS